ncbi:hypothetical protein [Paracraurococcus lichenis]|uniref:Uncharacterized protein n=1 Tax=Paracraurococcus lichenis TaxID=3064888 RepID=A0ABT9ECW8_9PROT|nr:hypothetical protein [Paracraurococcus sp. LOR1-02]MDO9713967.1 hypothetical protein [Paracraurococcus sp. LOR1-02]
MLPIDLRDLHDYVQRAVALISKAVDEGKAGEQRQNLLDAMQALDHVESVIDNAFAINLDMPRGESVVGMQTAASRRTAAQP